MPTPKPDDDADRGVWTIRYHAGKVRYDTDRTDEFMARVSPDFLHHLLGLVARPSSPELRTMIEKEWPLNG